MLKGGNLDIDVEVTSPRGKTLYSEDRQQTDKIPLEVSVGIFTFCFGNEFSSLTHKVVHFRLRPSETDPRALAREVHRTAGRPGVNTMVEQMMETVHEYATEVRHESAWNAPRNKAQLSLTNPRDALQHGERAVTD